MIAVVLLWRRQESQEREIADLQRELTALVIRSEDLHEAAPPPAASTDTEEDLRREWMARAVPLEHEPTAIDPELATEEATQLPDEPVPSDTFTGPTDQVFATEAPSEDSTDRTRGFDFEDIFGRRLPIWAGGIALAIAGIFLVRFSIEAGLLTPGVRAAGSFAFGIALLALAEIAFRFDKWIADERVRQALSGAGLATLYAAFYLAGTQYGLIGSGTAFLGLAAVTAGAVALALRYGLSSALLGLIGGFAAPALVASDDANVPLLTIYLALIAAGLAWTGARIGKPWLGFVALAGGFGWGAVLLAADLVDDADLAALGLLLVVLGAGVPMLAGRDAIWRWPRLAAAALASVQMALLIGLAGYEPLTWGLYLLLAAALAVLGWREAFLREANGFAAALGLCLLALWDPPAFSTYTVVAAVFALIFIGSPLALILRGKAREIDIWQIAAVPVALAFVNRTQWELWDDTATILRALPDLLLAAPVIAALRHLWRKRADWFEELALLTSAALLVLLANWVLAPEWAAPLAVTPVALALVWLANRREEPPFGWLACLFAAIGVAALIFGEHYPGELGRLIGLSGDTNTVQSTLRWAAAALPFAALAAIMRDRGWRIGLDAAAMLFAYSAAVQFLPNALVPAVLALAVAVIAWRLPSREGAMAAGLVLLGAWAAIPFGQWFAAGSEAIAMSPMLVDAVPQPWLVLERFVPAVLAALAAIGLRAMPNQYERNFLGAIAAILAIAGLHILYKQLFAIDTLALFQAQGMAERTVWQLILVGGGAVLLGQGRPAWTRHLGLLLVAFAAAHFIIFTLLIHNPLWDRQAVGIWPAANWILPAYAAAIAAILLLRHNLAEASSQGTLVANGAIMMLTAVFSLSELRHAFAGSYLITEPLGQTEDLLRSVVGILLAIGFLLWGRRTGQRDWRIGSLVLMLVAVGKVFLLDAAGLQGLLRIASFLALGVSLIGIGWLYSRQLSHRSEPVPD